MFTLQTKTMSETITKEDLMDLQRQITQALQEQVLNNIRGNVKPYMEVLGYSISLLEKLSCIGNEFAEKLQYSDQIGLQEYY